MQPVLINPIISEKSTSLSSQGVYAFRVSPGSNKPQIKKAVENIYKVKVQRVNLLKTSPKRRVFRGRVGVRPGYKKALVFLEKGQKIDLV